MRDQMRYIRDNKQYNGYYIEYNGYYIKYKAPLFGLPSTCSVYRAESIRSNIFDLIINIREGGG